MKRLLRKCRSLLPIIFILTGTLGSSSPPQKGAYPIKLDRPSHVGQRSKVHLVHSQTVKRRYFAGDRVTRTIDEQTEIDLSATMTVLKVGRRGNVREAEFIIDSCSLRKDGATRSLLKRGDVLLAELRGDDVHFRLREKPLADSVQAHLAEIITMSSDVHATNDEIIGTDQPQAVGSSWPINALLFARELALEGVGLKVDALKGDSRLVAVRPFRLGDSLEIETRMWAEDLTVHEIVVPDRRVEWGQFVVNMKQRVPLDNKLPVLHSEAQLILNFTIYHHPGSKDATKEELDARTSSTATVTPLSS